MTTLSGLMIKLEQTAAQRVLKTVTVTYGYTLTTAASQCADDRLCTVTVDILGHDLIIDDKLALGVDAHEVCLDQVEVGNARTFVVGQDLLNEDIGTDEIKLRINATDDQGNTVSAMTDIVRGDF
jgi:hypothetical protein